MHSLTAFIGASRQVVDEFSRRHPSAQRWDLNAKVTILTSGDSPKVIAYWQDDDRFLAAYGSAVKGADPRTMRALVGTVASAALPEDLADTVAFICETDGNFRAITGSSAHRLFRRRLPSGGTMVSTHLASVVTTGSPANVDRSYEDFYLGFGFHPDGRTMFVDIDELPPLSIWNPAEQKTRELRLAKVTGGGVIDTESGLIDLLIAATERQSEGVDHCAVLLGGFDSALVCALLRKLGKEVTAYTFDFGDDRFNQPKVDRVVEALDITHRWVHIDANRIGDGLERLPDYVNAPSAQPHYQLHTVFASQQARKEGFDLVLSGDGCDALFLGYPTVRTRSRFVSRLQRVPAVANRAALKFLGLSVTDRNLGHVARIGRSVIRAAALPYPASGHLPTQYIDDVTLARLRTQPPPQQAEPVEQTRIRLAPEMDEDQMIRLAFMGKNATAESRIKVDGAVMTAGAAQVTPYKDPATSQFVKSLPASALLPGQDSRRQLGKQYLIDTVIASGLLPADVVLQPKESPVTSPIDYWYMGDLRGRVLEQLDSLPFEWNRSYVENLLRPKRAEEWYRNRVALSPHALQVVGILLSYAAFARLTR